LPPFLPPSLPPFLPSFLPPSSLPSSLLPPSLPPSFLPPPSSCLTTVLPSLSRHALSASLVSTDSQERLWELNKTQVEVPQQMHQRSSSVSPAHHPAWRTGLPSIARLVRTESVPCDINNPLRYTDLHISQTLPKTNKITKDHIPVPYQPDSSSNPSSTTSSTPSSPAPPLPSSATPPSPLHPSPQSARQQKQFNLTASSYFKYKQQFIFPDVAPEAPPSRAPQVVLHPVLSEHGSEGNPLLQIEVEATSDNEEANDEDSGDEFEEMNLSLLSARNFPRKASQTSIFLQEWDVPFEQLEIGEMIGKGRFGRVFHGRWHGEVALRLIDIERDNEDQLRAFKREVMAYRNTRHENVVLFMGACMSPPHLAIITSLCKGRTLYSVVRDAKGMGYLHAKGILHKDMKSKNVFYDNGKVVITDFGLFTISGVLQAGSSDRSYLKRREDKLRIPNGWLCHLAPEIVCQLSPDTEEDKLPFSKQSDVFAFGTIWYELHAREWPYKSQPAEVILWQVGRGHKPNLSQIGTGKEISDILLLCWAHQQEERPSFSKLVDLLEKLPKRNRRLSHPGHFWKSAEYDILLLCWAHQQEERPSFSKLVDLLEKLPKRNRRLSHPGHFWKSAEYVR
ncbi:hypothetical protein CRUP_021500, partial [Coryphaenoides rupestris]